jgi:RimJ/RimL family protein N-acetyltransferase
MSPQPLSDDILHRAAALPLKPDPVTLHGRYIYLEPLDPTRDAAALYRVSNGEAITLGTQSHPAYDPDARIWQYMSGGPYPSLEVYQIQLQNMVTVPDILPFSIIDTASGQPIGSTSLMTNIPQWLKIEIGGIWVSPIMQGTKANTEATYLLLRHAFGLGYRRVEWKCNALNIKSRRAAERLGFRFEGIQEAHMIIKGQNRDTAWFRILDHEWSEIQQVLEHYLYA